MDEILPRHVVCLLGNWRTLDEMEAMVAKLAPPGFELDQEYSGPGEDDRMDTAFEHAADRVAPSFFQEDVSAVKAHKSVAYILSPRIPKAAAMQMSGMTLQMVATMLEGGALAAKSESAGVAHGFRKWVHLFSEYKTGYTQADPVRYANALYDAWVRRPLSDGKWWYSCGMHLLGLPDIEIEPRNDPREAIQCIDFIGTRLLAGETIENLLVDKIILPEKDLPPEKTEPKSLHHLVCKRYESDDFFYNPYGYIRVT
ncbi:MAG: hypothetical protein SGJ27_08115 [Candidatus Melainabacteria bacterium]|nr:hypothetical protein [Candidatus Melainabacteria bacterium]